MKIHFEHQLNEIKRLVGELAVKVESAVQAAVRAVARRDGAAAAAVIAGDDAIDRDEVRIEEECLKTLALYQPVAGDLRYVITLLKVNSELERIGDLAVNIAERAADLAVQAESPREQPDFAAMVFETRSMLKNALDALICRNAAAAAEVIRRDDVVDEENRAIGARLRTLVAAAPEHCEYYFDLLTVSRNIERIADGATNICEDVVYLEQGRIVRHTDRI